MFDDMFYDWLDGTGAFGISYGGFPCAPIGQLNTGPRWDDDTVPDCESGGFFGQGPGLRETRGPRIPGDLDLRGDAFPLAELKSVGGHLDLRGLAFPLPALTHVGGHLDCTGYKHPLPPPED